MAVGIGIYAGGHTIFAGSRSWRPTMLTRPVRSDDADHLVSEVRSLDRVFKQSLVRAGVLRYSVAAYVARTCACSNEFIVNSKQAEADDFEAYFPTRLVPN